MPKAHVDLIGINGGRGEVAGRLATQGRLDLGAMRPYFDEKTGKVWVTIYKGKGDPTLKSSYVTYQIQTNTSNTLRRDEWKALDDQIQEVAMNRLGGVQDLIDEGLTYNLGNAMGTTVLESHDVSDAFEAELTMDGVTRSKGDRPVYQHNYLPIPIIHVDFEINARVLAASRNMGNPLDTTSAERAARKVNEKLEKMLFTDTSYAYGETDSRSRNSIYSYINFPDRNTVSIGTHWDDLSSDIGSTIVTQVLSMKQASLDALHYGPNWKLYIPSNYETILDQDYDTTTPQTTIRKRILDIAGIKGIKVIDTLPADNVLLVELSKSTVRLVRGFGLQAVEWATEGGMITKYKVMTIQVPQVRSDLNSKCGVVHLA